MKRYINKMSIIITSVALLLSVVVGTTLAYIFTKTYPVENVFTPSKVACAVVENGNFPVTSDEVSVSIKENVQIKNIGDTEAYIRVAVIVNWKNNESGAVYAKGPARTDYTIDYAQNTGWVKGVDGYWYYTLPVSAVDDSETRDVDETLTNVLIDRCVPVDGKVPGGYHLSVEIVASAIQSTPTDVVTTQWISGVEKVDGTILVIKQGE